MKETYVFHKIKMRGKKSKYSAWFNADPSDALALLIDCERIDALGRSFPCSEAEQLALRNGPWTSYYHTVICSQ